MFGYFSENGSQILDGLLFGLGLEPLFGAGIGLPFPQAIDRAPSGQGYHPAEWFPFLRGEIFRLVPDLHKDFLQEIVRFCFIMNHPQDECLQDAIVAVIQHRKRLRIASLDRMHEFEIAQGAGLQLRDDRRNPWGRSFSRVFLRPALAAKVHVIVGVHRFRFIVFRQRQLVRPILRTSAIECTQVEILRRAISPRNASCPSASTRDPLQYFNSLLWKSLRSDLAMSI